MMIKEAAEVIWGIIMWFLLIGAFLYFVPTGTRTASPDSSRPVVMRDHEVIVDGHVVCTDPVMDSDRRTITCE